MIIMLIIKTMQAIKILTGIVTLMVGLVLAFVYWGLSWLLFGASYVALHVGLFFGTRSLNLPAALMLAIGSGFKKMHLVVRNLFMWHALSTKNLVSNLLGIQLDNEPRKA